jgi:hypothetical protein
LTANSLLKISGEYVNFLDYPGWQYLTHVLFMGLTCDDQGNVKYVGEPNIWAPLLNSVRRKYPYIKVFLGFPPLFNSKLVKYYEQDKFWDSLLTCIMGKNHVRYDGFLMNIEANRVLPDSFCASLFHLKTYFPVWAVINNKRDAYPLSFIESLCRATDRIIMNSYGYVKYRYDDNDEAREQVGNVLPLPESALVDFNATFASYPSIPNRSIVMGVDTCGIRFQLNENGYAQNLWMVPLHEIERLKITGTKVGNRTYKFREIYDKDTISSLLKLAGDREIISFDNYRVRKSKLALACKLGGVCIGELVYDMNPLHPRGLLQLSYIKMAGNLDNTKNVCSL